MNKRPRIGITMRLEIETRRFYLGRDYSEAIEASGGVPVHLGLIPKREYITEALAGLDGMLLPGSNTDVDPHYYGEEPHPKLGTVIPEKDATEMLVLEEIERMNLPLMAICYGMQALNVARGGTLVQDIETLVEGGIKHEQGIPHARHSHSVEISADSILAQMDAVRSSETPVRINSSHHQAVGVIGRDLKATAWARDGVIECVEDVRPERFVLGVQWHPEITRGIDELSTEIFDHFVARCQPAFRAANDNVVSKKA